MPKKRAVLPLSDIEIGILSEAERLLYVEDNYEEAIRCLLPNPMVAGVKLDWVVVPLLYPFCNTLLARQPARS